MKYRNLIEEKAQNRITTLSIKAFREMGVYCEFFVGEVQTGNSRKLWSMLRYKHIPCERLQDVIKEVYGAYTTHVRMQPLGNKPRYVAYSVHDFKTVFPELTDSEDSDDEYFRPSQRKDTTL